MIIDCSKDAMINPTNLNESSSQDSPKTNAQKFSLMLRFYPPNDASSLLQGIPNNTLQIFLQRLLQSILLDLLPCLFNWVSFKFFLIRPQDFLQENGLCSSSRVVHTLFQVCHNPKLLCHKSELFMLVIGPRFMHETGLLFFPWVWGLLVSQVWVLKFSCKSEFCS